MFDIFLIFHNKKMGLRDAHVTKLIECLFFGAMVNADDAAVWREAEFLWIDGSLFYRAIRWSETGPQWRHYLDRVLATLAELLARCPRLRYVVYQIDKYGDTTIAARPKEPTQASRYADCQELPNPDAIFTPDGSVAGIGSSDPFATHASRFAFNAMVSEALVGFFRDLVCAEDNTIKLAIVDGYVSADKRTGLRLFGCGDDPHVADRDALFCPHSEGDIGAAHWLPRFADVNCVIHSADVDLQQVTLQVVRRFADGGMRPEQLPRIHLHKRANATEKTFDMKRYYQLVCDTMTRYMAADDPSHPLDVWCALTASTGNDFAHPWLCSSECMNHEKDNNGVRLQALWSAFMLHGRRLGHFFEPTMGADQWPHPWSVHRLRTWIYPMEMRVETWRRLVERAALMQATHTALKMAQDTGLLASPRYVRGQVARMAWSLGYYANSALLGTDVPRGIECDARGRSLFGWVEDSSTGKAVLSNNVSPTCETVCGVAADRRRTAPPSPMAEEDPVACFQRLEMECQ